MSGQSQPQTHYFTCRLEIGYSGAYGNSSAYEKLEALQSVLNASNRSSCQEAFERGEGSYIDCIDELVQEGSRPKGGVDRRHSGDPESLPTDCGTNPHFRFSEAVNCSVSVKRMDYLSKEQTSDHELETMDTHLANLQIINVPTLFDVGC